MTFAPFPAAAAWRHEHARDGYEVAFFRPDGDGWLVEGSTSATEAGASWVVSYAIRVDGAHRTRWARIQGWSAAGPVVTAIEADGTGGWRIDGTAAPHLDGCLDVDLEASAVTNAFPAHRLAAGAAGAAGIRHDAPAAYVRALGLGVARLEQTYTRTGERTYAYTAPEFGVVCDLAYDASGLVTTYPGLAVRVA